MREGSSRISENKLGPGGHKASSVALIAMAAANKPKHAHAGGAPSLHARNAVFDHQAGLRSMSRSFAACRKRSGKGFPLRTISEE